MYILVTAGSVARVFLAINQDVDSLVSKCQWGQISPSMSESQDPSGQRHWVVRIALFCL